MVLSYLINPQNGSAITCQRVLLVDSLYSHSGFYSEHKSHWQWVDIRLWVVITPWLNYVTQWQGMGLPRGDGHIPSFMYIHRIIHQAMAANTFLQPTMSSWVHPHTSLSTRDDGSDHTHLTSTKSIILSLIWFQFMYDLLASTTLSITAGILSKTSTRPCCLHFSVRRLHRSLHNSSFYWILKLTADNAGVVHHLSSADCWHCNVWWHQSARRQTRPRQRWGQRYKCAFTDDKSGLWQAWLVLDTLRDTDNWLPCDIHLRKAMVQSAFFYSSTLTFDSNKKQLPVVSIPRHLCLCSYEFPIQSGIAMEWIKYMSLWLRASSHCVCDHRVKIAATQTFYMPITKSMCHQGFCYCPYHKNLQLTITDTP